MFQFNSNKNKHGKRIFAIVVIVLIVVMVLSTIVSALNAL